MAAPKPDLLCGAAVLGPVSISENQGHDVPQSRVLVEDSGNVHTKGMPYPYRKRLHLQFV
jgi:hypothetical protein